MGRIVAGIACGTVGLVVYFYFNSRMAAAAVTFGGYATLDALGLIPSPYSPDIREMLHGQYALTIDSPTPSNHRASAPIEFAPDDKMREMQPLIEVLFREVLPDEGEPLFVSDEATLLDVSGSPPEEIARRCAAYYGANVTEDDLVIPLWRLLPLLEARRTRNRT